MQREYVCDRVDVVSQMASADCFQSGISNTLAARNTTYTHLYNMHTYTNFSSVAAVNI